MGDVAVRPNFLDRLISSVAPVWGFRRMAARVGMMAAENLGGRVGGVRRTSASRKGTLSNYDVLRETRYSVERAGETTMDRAEDLVVNDGNAKSCVASLALNVVGPGLRPQSYPAVRALGIDEAAGEAFAESAEQAWRTWCVEADATDVSHFEDLQYQAVYSMFTHGEFLHLPVWDETPGRSFGLALQALHPARLRTPADKRSDAAVRQGVQLAPDGKPAGYWIAMPKGDRPLSGLSSAEFRFAPRKIAHRWGCMHRFRAELPEAVRGESVISPALKQFRDMADYVDYELVGALIASSFTVFLELSGDGMGNIPGLRPQSGQPGQFAYYPELMPGNVLAGPVGYKPHILSSNRPAPSFEAFYTRLLRSAAASTGQPYEIVAKDFSKTNYSSARAALLEVWKLHTLYQDWFIRSYLQQIWIMVLEEAWLRGMLTVPAGAPDFYEAVPAWASCIWTRPPRGNVDPVKEREADNLGLDNLTETRSALCASRGLDFEDTVRTRAREDKIMRRYGVEPKAQAAKAAPAAKADDGESEPEEAEQ